MPKIGRIEVYVALIITNIIGSILSWLAIRHLEKRCNCGG